MPHEPPHTPPKRLPLHRLVLLLGTALLLVNFLIPPWVFVSPDGGGDVPIGYAFVWPPPGLIAVWDFDRLAAQTLAIGVVVGVLFLLTRPRPFKEVRPHTGTG
jgi:hypothetical protein